MDSSSGKSSSAAVSIIPTITSESLRIGMLIGIGVLVVVAGGIAFFGITRIESVFDPRTYYWDIQWIRSDDPEDKEDVLSTGTVMVLDRVSDV